jgi:hypothetical protein
MGSFDFISASLSRSSSSAQDDKLRELGEQNDKNLIISRGFKLGH